MLTPAEIHTVQESLARGPKTTAQLAIDCEWSLDEALKHLEDLELEGFVARSGERASNAYSIEWEATASDASPESPLATKPAFESEARDGLAPKTSTPDNPYQPPAVDEARPAQLSTPGVGGSFWLGLAAGFFGGMFFGFLLQRQMRPRTLRGLHWGIGIITLGGLFLRLLRALI